MVKKNNNIKSIWEKVEKQWPVKLPVSNSSESINYNTLKNNLESFLLERKVAAKSFSHFGFVVKSIDSSIDIVKTFDNKISGKLIKDWVESYKVYVGRIMFGDSELEFIEPKGESFFDMFLKEKGEGLHHLAFRVSDIESCFEKLKKNGVETIDSKPRSGSHGKVAFFKPGLSGSIHIELFQEYKQHT